MFSNSKYVKELKPSDFDSYETFKLNTSERCTVVLFYCDWCPHCRNLRDTWEQFAKIAGFINVCSFDCEKYKGHILKINEERPGMVQGYPTIWFFKYGTPIEKYKEERTKEKLVGKSMEVCERASK